MKGGLRFRAVPIRCVPCPEPENQPPLFSSEPASGKVLHVKGLKYEIDELKHLIESTEEMM
jgi:hypothetical protein